MITSIQKLTSLSLESIQKSLIDSSKQHYREHHHLEVYIYNYTECSCAKGDPILTILYTLFARFVYILGVHVPCLLGKHRRPYSVALRLTIPVPCKPTIE
jgi:hypothetical protein